MRSTIRCVKMVAETEMRIVAFRKMSARGTVCWRHSNCSVPTDDPGLVLNKVKVVTIPTQPAFPKRELRVGNVPDGTERKHSVPLQG